MSYSNKKIEGMDVTKVQIRINSLIDKSKVTNVHKLNLDVTGKILQSQIDSIVTAINTLESDFSNNCCESNHCQTCQSNGCQTCQSCQSCQNGCYCQTCQKQCKEQLQLHSDID